MPQQYEGFDNRSQEEILAQRAHERQARTMELVEGMGMINPADRTGAQIGGLLSGLVAKKYAPPTLTPDEQRRTQAIQTATQKTKMWRSQNPGVSVEDLGLQQQKHLAEALLSAGDMQGLQFAQAYAQQSMAKRQAEAEMAKLEADTSYTQQRTRTDWLTQGRDSVTQVYLQGSTFGDNPVSAFIDKDGKAFDVSTGQPLGKYFITPPPDPNKRGPYRTSDFGIGTTEARDLREQRVNVMNAASSYLKMAGILKEGAKDGSIEFLSASGTLSALATSVVDNATAIARTLEKAMGIESGTTADAQRLRVEGTESDLTNDAAAKSYVEANADLVAALEPRMPANIRANSELKTRWASSVVKAAYANARAEQPGARQISNDAFKNAVVQLSALTTDPEAFRKVTIDTMRGQIQEFRDRLGGYGREALESVYGPRALSDFETRMKDFDGVFVDVGEFGTAGTPGPGLTESSEEEWTLDENGNPVKVR